MPRNEQFSSSEEYDEVEGNRRHDRHHRRREGSNALAKSARRTSDASTRTNPRRQSSATRPQYANGYEDQRVAQTPAHRLLVTSSPPSHLTSSPISQATTSGRTTSSYATDYSQLSPFTPFSSEPRRTARQTVFDSKLSGLLEEFASIESGDYQACYTFVKQNPDIWDRDEKLLLRDAIAALVASKEAHAKQCVQRAVMIQECTNSSPVEIRNFFEGLINKKKGVLEKFLKNCSDATANLKAKLPASTATTSEHKWSQNTDPIPAIGSMSIESGQTRYHGGQKSADQFPGPTVRTHQNPHTRQEGNTTYGKAPVVGAVRRRGASDVPTVFVDADGRTVDTLDHRYKLRANSATFFTFGRVFATPWHTALGANQANSMQQWVVKDCFGESILTHIQRMVVVKEGHGFSWCVPITTYAGRGVAKTGLSDDDRRAHAIIYMEGTEARSTTAERDMMNKNPIAVHAAAVDQKLDVMSRINFGKVHTIEHNVKVMDVGKISRDDTDDFKAYWNQYR